MSISEPPSAAAGDAAARAADAHIELSSSVASLELSVIGADFTPVASGLGKLSAAVPAGFYQVVARAGPVIDRTLISVAPGETYRDDRVEVRFPAPAPVNDTSTTHEYHQAAAEQASGMLGQMPGPASGLAIILRDVRGTDGPPLLPPDVAGFSLLDQFLTPVPGFEQGWQVRPGEAVATWSGRLAAGGYALRLDPTRITEGERIPASSQPFDQSLWLSEGWATMVFITTGPGGPQPSGASIHMGQLGMGWSPYDTQVGLALELANWGLREGRSVVPDDLLNVLLNTKFVNPMLGIVGAHSMLLRSDVNWDLLDVVLHNLELMVPGHPDVIALRWMAARGRALAAGATPPPPAPGAPVGSAFWPPMLLTSYRALIAMDATDSNAIVNGSPAELAASHLLVQGIWTSWTPFLPAPPAPPPPPTDAAPDAEAEVVPTAMVLTRIGEDPSLLDGVDAGDPATDRVVGYLRALAVLEGERGRASRFKGLTSQEVALATTLPVATVERSLGNIATVVPPPLSPTDTTPDNGGGGGGGGGGGHSIGVIAAIAAIALLLVGAVGVTAWCAGDEACPLRITVAPTDSPTQPPTQPPTPAPTTTPTEPPRPTPTPPAPIFLSYPSTVDFGPITIGGLPARQSAVLTAPEPVDFRVELVDDAGTAFAADGCDWRPQVAGGWVCAASLTFTPRAETQYVGALNLVVVGQPEPKQIQLVGVGVPMILSFEPTLEFDTVFVGYPETRTVIISAKEPGHLEFAEDDDPAGVFEPVVTSCDLILNDSAYYQCFVDVTLSAIDNSEYFGALGIFTGDMEVDRVALHGYGNTGID